MRSKKVPHLSADEGLSFFSRRGRNWVAKREIFLSYYCVTHPLQHEDLSRGPDMMVGYVVTLPLRKDKGGNMTHGLTEVFARHPNVILFQVIILHVHVIISILLSG